MPVADTSIRSYRSLLDSGRTTRRQHDILRVMVEGKTYSRRELARLTGLEINCICGRVRELLDAGALIEAAQRKDPDTGQTIRPVALNVGEQQGRMFF